MVFDGFGGVSSLRASSVPTQTIGQLQISNNTTVELLAFSTVTLTIAGGTGVDLGVAAGSAMIIRQAFGGQTTNVLVGSGATAEIFGRVQNYSLGTLNAVDVDGVRFKSGAVFLQTFANPPFTAAGTPDAVRFESGSTYEQTNDVIPGPWGLPAPNSKVRFDDGSLYVYRQFTSGALDIEGRTLGDFQMNAVNPGVTSSATGTGAVSIGSITVTNGTLNLGLTGPLTIRGNVTVPFSKTLNFNAASPSTVTLGGTSAQTLTISGSLTVSATETFAVNNANGVVLGSNVTLPNGTLTFVSGNVTTGANTLAIASTANVTGAGAGSGWVVGNLRRNVPLGGAQSFPIGGASAYAPVGLQVNGLGSAFDLTASTATPDHPQLASSELNPAKSVNRHWTLTPATAPSFTDYSATFGFAPGDVDGAANTAAFLVARYDGSWTTLNVGTRTATSTEATGVTSFSGFAIGEEITHTITATAGANGTIAPSGAVPVTDGASQGFTITPDANYYILDVLVDGVSVGAVASHTFTNVTTDHTIDASFATGCLAAPPGMVAWWPLDEVSDPTAIDLLGPAHGAFVGGATHLPGKVAGGIHLANGAQYVAAADDPSLNFGTGNFSIDAWVRSADASTSVRTILDKRSAAGGPLLGYSMYISFGHLGVQLADASGFTNFGSSTGNLVDGQWHMVCVTVDRASATGGKLYVDGALVSTFAPTVRPGSLTNAGDLRIGQAYDNGSIGFNGDIDEVELYSRELTATEVSQIFQAGSFGKCKPALTGCIQPPTGLLAWYPFDETSGTTAADLLFYSNASYEGGASHSVGKVAGALHVGSATQFASAIDSPNLNFGSGSFSIDAWVKTGDAATSVRTIVDKRSSSGGLKGYSLYISFGRLGLQLADAGGFTNFGSSTGNLTDGGWHFVAATVDRAGGATGGKLYVDGAVVATFNPTVRAGSVTNIGALRVGQAYNNSSINFNGDIDEVELVGRALDASEIAAIYAADVNGKCKQTVLDVPDPQPAPRTALMSLTNNPLRSGETVIRFSLAEEERPEIRVFDVTGRLVRTIEPGLLPAGEHGVGWDGSGSDGSPLSRGVYFVKIRLGASGVERTQRLVIIR